MSASITIGSLSLNSTGKVLTGTLSGGSGSGYTPSSGVTGLTVRKNATGGEIYHQASAAISGTTLTVTLDTPVPSGTSVVFDGAVGSNITDSGSNTLVGQTGTSVTYSSGPAATAFAITNSGILAAGLNVNTGTNQGHPWRQSQSSITIEFTFTGTDLWMSQFPQAGTNSFTVSIDGGATETIATSSTGWCALPIIKGLSDTAHTVRITHAAITIYDTTNTFFGFGASPAVARPTGKTGTVLGLRAAAGTWVRFSPCFAVGISAQNFVSAITANNHEFEIKATCTSLWLHGILGGWKVRVLVDNVEVVATTVSNTAAYGWAQIASGLDGSNEHTYRVQLLIANGNYVLTDLMGVGGTGVNTGVTIAARTSVYADGDSITNEGVGLGADALVDARNGMWSRLGDALHYATSNIGQPAAGVPSTVNGALTGSTNLPSFACERWGSNNAATLDNVATFKATYKTFLQATRTQCPSATIVGLRILNRQGVDVTAYNAAKSAAVAELVAAGDANMYYVDDTAGFDNTSGVHTYDGTHPNDTGYAILAANLAALPPFAASTAVSHRSLCTLGVG
jgi:hypothetical protein